jgi:hypothetical protein
MSGDVSRISKIRAVAPRVDCSEAHSSVIALIEPATSIV